MLKTLGERHQVMCVTHLPQVAASAAQQWRVSKQMRDGRATSAVELLGARERIEEIARMLDIATGTSKAQLHRARRLLAQQLKEQGFEA